MSSVDMTAWEQFSDAALSQETSPVRSLLDEQFHNMKTHSDWMGETPDTIYLTGGASQNQGICQTIANIFNTNVQRMGTSASASLGAAMRAAHATNEFSLHAACIFEDTSFDLLSKAPCLNF